MAAQRDLMNERSLPQDPRNPVWERHPSRTSSVQLKRLPRKEDCTAYRFFRHSPDNSGFNELVGTYRQLLQVVHLFLDDGVPHTVSCKCHAKNMERFALDGKAFP